MTISQLDQTQMLTPMPKALQGQQDYYLANVLKFVLAHPKMRHLILVANLETADLLVSILGALAIAVRQAPITSKRSITVAKAFQELQRPDSQYRYIIGTVSLLGVGLSLDTPDVALSSSLLLSYDRASQFSGRNRSEEAKRVIFFRTEEGRSVEQGTEEKVLESNDNIREAPYNERLLVTGVCNGATEMALAWHDSLNEQWYYAPQGGRITWTVTSWQRLLGK